MCFELNFKGFNLFVYNNKLDSNFFIILDISMTRHVLYLSTRLVERKRLLVSWKSNRIHSRLNCIFKCNLICVFIQFLLYKVSTFYVKFSTPISSLISQINSNPYFFSKFLTNIFLFTFKKSWTVLMIPLQIY